MTDQDRQRFRDFERTGWDEVASEYARVTDGVSDQVAESVLDAAAVGAGDRVLDVASGPGWTAAAAARRGAHVTGVDISPSMAEEARRRNPDVHFEVAPAEELPFADASFDAVVSSFGMPHFYDHHAVFRQAHRVLAGDGRIAVASWHPPASNPFFGVALGSIARCGSLDVDLPDGVDMFAWADDAVSGELFTGTGFDAPVREDVEMRIVSDDGPAAVVEILESASVRSRALYFAQTDEARSAIRLAIAEMLEPMRDGGTWKIPLSAFVLSSRRR